MPFGTLPQLTARRPTARGSKTDKLIDRARLKVINLGLSSFAEDLRSHGLTSLHVRWQPPARGDQGLAARIANLKARFGSRIRAANEQAVARIQSAEPVLLGVARAGDVIDGLEDRMILHAGPPIEWERMCGPMRGAIAGAAVYEGWASDLADGFAQAAAGRFEFQPNHHFDAVGPMTGLTTQSMAVMVVENKCFGNRAYCTLNEGLGKVMRFGGNDASVIARLRWLARVLGPNLNAALEQAGGVDLKALVARGLAMGDEMHQRNAACTSLFIREISPHLVRSVAAPSEAGEVLEFMGGNDQLFLNMTMVMGKAIMDPVRGIEGSSVVTAMARNGTDFGVHVSCTGDTWFVAPVEMPRGLYFPGFSITDANPDMGDSTIVETIGLGGFAMAAAPAVAGFVGAGSASESLDYTRSMYDITCARSTDWKIPALDFAGIPTGIDILEVVSTGQVPTINTGIAHREPGVGQVGAGVVEAPFGCFVKAAVAFCERMEAA